MANLMLSLVLMKKYRWIILLSQEHLSMQQSTLWLQEVKASSDIKIFSGHD